MKTIENIDIARGNARNIQEINKIDSPRIITGFLPILSDNVPVIGEKTAYIIFNRSQTISNTAHTYNLNI